MIGEYIELRNEIKAKSSIKVNGVDLSAKKSFFPYEAAVISRNNVISNISGQISKTNYETELEFDNKKYLIKSVGQSNTIETVKKVGEFFEKAINNSVKEAANDFLPKIYDADNNLVGECEYGEDNVLHIVYKLFGKKFDAYISSTEKHEYVYCVYDENNQLIAEIKKSSKILHGHARYTVYSKSEYFKEALLITSCWSLRFTKQDGEVGTARATSYTATVFREKYDQSFINNIVQTEGESNLPENMPMVAEYIKKSNRGLDVKIYYIGFVVIIIIVLILLKCFKVI